MKAIMLAGGKGTRLRPLTIHTPKPIVPIFNRPFLHYQIDLLKQIPEIDEVILSLNYQPGRIQEVFGDGTELGIHIRYVVEPTPLGTGGAIKFAAGPNVTEPVVVFNGDVLTSVDLPALLALHRERKAKATITLTPVDNPTAYGLVETDGHQNIKAFIEKLLRDRLDLQKSRFSEQQIAFILKRAEDGTTVEEVCRKAGISIQTYYRWRSKYGGLMPSEMKRLKQLEEENGKLKKIVADLSLDKEMLQDVIRRKI